MSTSLAPSGRRLGRLARLMARRARPAASAQRRLVYVVVPVLILLQIVTLLVIRYANRNIAEDTLAKELNAGAQVFRFAVSERSASLRQTTDVLVKDYGFREAMTRGSRATIDSALNNLLVRMNAAVVVLENLDGKVIGTGLPLVRGVPVRYPGLTDDSLAHQTQAVQVNDSNIMPLQIDGRRALLQWVKVPVRTPLPVAYLSVAYEIDNRVAHQFKAMTQMDFMFMTQRNGGPWRVYASSLPQQQNHQPGELGNIDIRRGADGYLTLPLDGPDLRMLLVDVGSNGPTRVVAAVGTAIEEVIHPFEKLERVTAVLILVSALLSSAALYRASSKVVRPLDQFAYRDGLTQLANRRLFEMNLELAAQNLRTLGRGYSLMVMDLNKFKAINDTLGHAAGDQVLQQAASRILQVLRASDTVARLGGDEFAVLLLTDDEGKARAIAEQIVQQVCLPMPLAGGGLVEVGVSIGIARSPAHGSAPADLLHKADQAMYTAKLARSGFSFWAEHTRIPDSA